ncbi:hypothetical protein F2Q70_00002950 [Brassica cretica]|uniref:Uncharacterized protein n=1 Tax=Brassica cretica TaxID=69181 RepID=A0A8S9ILT8_BRACR|nr:hypothetical protein F2Q70_00002950 [Brassica cretica]KAF3566247.1 hypothetical protein DY000_02014617 [Brassica cretica]
MIMMDHEKTNSSSVSWAKLGQAQCSSLKCRSAPAAGLLAQSAGTAGNQLNSARWSVGSSDHWVGPGSYRAGWLVNDGYGPVGSWD